MASALLSSARRRAASGIAWMQATVVWRVWERLLEVEFFDRSVAIAGKAFVSFFPLVIVIAAFVPPTIRNDIIATLLHRLGVVGSAKEEVKGAFSDPSSIRNATGLLGLLFTFLFATSFTTSLQRTFLRAWRRPTEGSLMTYARCAMWLVCFLIYLTVLGSLRNGLGGTPAGTAVFAVLALAGSVAAWTGTSWILLQGQVRFVALLPTGLLCGLLLCGYAVIAPLWMPSQIISDRIQFGFFGIALALITWLSGAAACILIGVTGGVVLVEDQGRVGALCRLGLTDVLIEGASPPLPAPPPRKLGSALSARR